MTFITNIEHKELNYRVFKEDNQDYIVKVYKQDDYQNTLNFKSKQEMKDYFITEHNLEVVLTKE